MLDKDDVNLYFFVCRMLYKVVLYCSFDKSHLATSDIIMHILYPVDNFYFYENNFFIIFYDEIQLSSPDGIICIDKTPTTIQISLQCDIFSFFALCSPVDHNPFFVLKSLRKSIVFHQTHYFCF